VSPLASALTNDEAAELVASKYNEKTNGWCLNAADPNKVPEKIQKDNLFDNDADGVRVCYEYCLPFEKVFGYAGMMVQKASSTAGCACYFDEGTLKPALDPLDPNTNGKSVGPVKGYGSSTNDECYPFKGYEGAPREENYDGKGLFLKLDGAVIEVPNKQISYKSFAEDNRPIDNYLIDIRSTTATTKGNMWRALELPDPLSIYELGDFVVSFDFSLEEAGQIHGICFEENLIFRDTDKPDLGSDSKRCLTIAYFEDLGDVPDIIPTHYQTRVGGKHRYVLNLSKIFKSLQGDQNAEPNFKSLSGVKEAEKQCDASGCCSQDFKTCIPFCGTTKNQCLSCGQDVGWICGEQRNNCKRKFDDCTRAQNSCCDGLSCVLVNPGYRQCQVAAPTPSPTPSPGSVGLNECEGKCDSDADCSGSLRCFKRGLNVKFVPGCDGVRGTTEGYCYDPDYNTKEFFIRYIVFISDEDRKDSRGVRSQGKSIFSNIDITTSLTSCLKDEPDFSFSLSDCTAVNFLAAIKAKMEATDACAAVNKRDPLLELFAMFDATEETDVYRNIERICSGAYKYAGYDVYGDKTLSMDADTERQITGEFLDGGSVWNYGKWDAGTGTDTAAIERVSSTLSGSRVLEWPNHHALDQCDVGAAMCCTTSSRDSSGANPNSEICYVDMAASRRSARVNDGYSIYGQDQTNDVYCEAFAWGTDEGSIKSALKGNALFEIGFANMLNGSVEQIPGAPLCGCLDRMPVVTNAKCTQVTSVDSSVEVTFMSNLGVFDSTFNLGTIMNADCGDFVSHYKDLEGGNDTPDTSFVAERIVGDTGCADATAAFLATKRLGYKTET